MGGQDKSLFSCVSGPSSSIGPQSKLPAVFPATAHGPEDAPKVLGAKCPSSAPHRERYERMKCFSALCGGNSVLADPLLRLRPLRFCAIRPPLKFATQLLTDATNFIPSAPKSAEAG